MYIPHTLNPLLFLRALGFLDLVVGAWVEWVKDLVLG